MYFCNLLCNPLVPKSLLLLLLLQTGSWWLCQSRYLPCRTGQHWRCGQRLSKVERQSC